MSRLVVFGILALLALVFIPAPLNLVAVGVVVVAWLATFRGFKAEALLLVVVVLVCIVGRLV